MADHQQPQAAAQAKQDKPVFFFGVVRGVNELSVFICEHCLRILKAHAMLALYIPWKAGAEAYLCLTFDLTGRQRQNARPGLAKMYRVPLDLAWSLAVGVPLERVVRLHCTLL